jgi:hypothetical protein
MVSLLYNLSSWGVRGRRITSVRAKFVRPSRKNENKKAGDVVQLIVHLSLRPWLQSPVPQKKKKKKKKKKRLLPAPKPGSCPKLGFCPKPGTYSKPVASPEGQLVAPTRSSQVKSDALLRKGLYPVTERAMSSRKRPQTKPRRMSSWTWGGPGYEPGDLGDKVQPVQLWTRASLLVLATVTRPTAIWYLQVCHSGTIRGGKAVAPGQGWFLPAGTIAGGSKGHSQETKGRRLRAGDISEETK